MKRRSMSTFGLGLAVLGNLTFAPVAGAGAPVTAKKVAAAFQFTATTVDGKHFVGASLAGKPSVLWFWAPWCTICRGESPDLVALANAYKGKINIVGVASLGPVGDMKNFVKETHTGLFTHIADPKGDIWNRFEIISQPSFILITKSGVPYRFVGSLPKSALFSLTSQLIQKA